MRIFAAFFIPEIRQHRAPQFTIFQSDAKFREIRRKCLDMRIVLLRINSQVIARQRSRAPSLVKGMAKQVVWTDATIKFGEEMLELHEFHLSQGMHKYKGLGCGIASTGAGDFEAGNFALLELPDVPLAVSNSYSELPYFFPGSCPALAAAIG